MKKFFLISIISLATLTVFSQGEIDDQSKIFWRNERTFALMLNSNGFGGNFRYGKRIDGFRKTLYEIELNYLKHQKEIKIPTVTNKNIVYGKINSVYTLKGAIGYQKELFQKRDLGSISIRYFTNIGPSFALIKPSYYEYYNSETGSFYYGKFEKHNYPNMNGKAPFTKGFDGLSLSPGTYGKFGLTFEYSKIDEIFHALELGVGLDAYILPVKIMETPPQKVLYVLPDEHFFITLFITYRFGRIIDTQFSPKRNRLDNILTE